MASSYITDSIYSSHLMADYFKRVYGKFEDNAEMTIEKVENGFIVQKLGKTYVFPSISKLNNFIIAQYEPKDKK